VVISALGFVKEKPTNLNNIMCIISHPATVTDTRIFVALDRNHTRQIVVYANTASTTPGAVMILPVPNPTSLKFINLSEYPTIFDDLGAGFQTRSTTNMVSFSARSGELQVHKVGGYLACIANSANELRRLPDQTFGSVDHGLVQLLNKRYPQFGFVVCRLNGDAKTEYHPIAYAHNVTLKDRMFVPTYHIHAHDASGPMYEEPVADWHHDIYALGMIGVRNFVTIEERFLQRDKIDFTLDPTHSLTKITIHGSQENSDIEIMVTPLQTTATTYNICEIM